eukprot:TRINITY_DN4007_c0_g1_i2.p1 TRINITY_DN4007_c0_g1~~TRINITY_DN4007_c0_g1_i2.p1  ORF type:complete len:204 (+),score=31.45 TRINITY_DN4007_c0_g1_i2:89-613(+)
MGARLIFLPFYHVNRSFAIMDKFVFNEDVVPSKPKAVPTTLKKIERVFIPTEPKYQPGSVNLIEDIPNQPVNPHTLTISIVGKANAGKSCFMNQLMKSKISIVSPKSQTTRETTTAILTRENKQLVFEDNPGFVDTGETKKRQREIIISAWDSIKDASIDKNDVNRSSFSAVCA